jgi:hypothetical protein
LESAAAAPRWIAMRPRGLAVLLVTVACHGGGPARPLANTPPAPPPTVAFMAGLFGGDRTLIYDVTQEASFFDDQDPAADASGVVKTASTDPVTCHLAVATLGRYRTATIACDDGAAATSGARVLDELERTYATDGAQLWRLEGGELPTTVADLEAALPDAPDLVAGQPSVEQGGYDDTSDDDDGDGNPDDGEDDARFGTVHRVTATTDGWCVEDEGWGGDEGGASWCVSAARGVTAVTWYFAGGSSQDQRAELRAP